MIPKTPREMLDRIHEMIAEVVHEDNPSVPSALSREKDEYDEKMFGIGA